MGKLKKYAKKTKRKSHHQYPWKPETETFVLFSTYCDSLNLSINEALNHLVNDEIAEYRKSLSRDEIEEMAADFEMNKEEKPKKARVQFTPMFEMEEEPEEEKQETTRNNRITE